MNINVTDEYAKLSDDEKQEFKRIVMQFISNGVMLEKVYNTNDKKIKTNRDYRFIEFNLELIREYLSMIDINIVEDRNNGMFIGRGSHANFIQLDKLQTIFLLILRIMYDEKHEEASLNSEIYFKMSDILEKGNVLGIINENPPNIKIEKAMRTFNKHKIVCKIKGRYTDLDSQYLLYPTITNIVNNQNINEVIKEFNENKSETELQDYFEGNNPANEEMEYDEDN